MTDLEKLALISKGTCRPVPCDECPIYGENRPYPTCPETEAESDAFNALSSKTVEAAKTMLKAGQATGCAIPENTPGRTLPEGMREKVWKPGQSGNPGGRPKMPEELKLAFREACPRALGVLLDLMENTEAEDGARIRAAQTILDRAYGKVPQVDDDGKALGGTIILVSQEDITGI